LGKVEDQIVEILRKSGRPLSLIEIAEQIGKPPKKVFGPVRKLFENGKVNCDIKSHTYQLVKQ
jgi:DNA-binding IclR family transcriptional regulator